MTTQSLHRWLVPNTEQGFRGRATWGPENKMRRDREHSQNRKGSLGRILKANLARWSFWVCRWSMRWCLWCLAGEGALWDARQGPLWGTALGPPPALQDSPLRQPRGHAGGRLAKELALPSTRLLLTPSLFLLARSSLSLPYGAFCCCCFWLLSSSCLSLLACCGSCACDLSLVFKKKKACGNRFSIYYYYLFGFLCLLHLFYVGGFCVIYSLTDQWKRLCVYLFDKKRQDHSMFFFFNVHKDGAKSSIW